MDTRRQDKWAGEDLSLTSMRVRDCFIVAEDGYKVSPCRRPHDGQIYARAVIDVPTFPGIASLRTWSEGLCGRYFNTAVHTGRTGADLKWSYVYGLEEAWNASRDARVIVCAVRATSGRAYTGGVVD